MTGPPAELRIEPLTDERFPDVAGLFRQGGETDEVGSKSQKMRTVSDGAKPVHETVISLPTTPLPGDTEQAAAANPLFEVGLVSLGNSILWWARRKSFLQEWRGFFSFYYYYFFFSFFFFLIFQIYTSL